MIFYRTDNSISKAVGEAFRKSGVRVEHVMDFMPTLVPGITPIFYGILRGTGAAMRYCQAQGIDYYYMDNGYYDAVYMDRSGLKSMNGTYRICKNDMIEPFKNPFANHFKRERMRVLVIPPSPYTANMYDTTPEDWLQYWGNAVKEQGDTVIIRDKTCETRLADQLNDSDAVIAFNSISALTAIDHGLYVFTTHGVVRNAAQYFQMHLPRYSPAEFREFYKPKQFTLSQIAEGKYETAL